MNSKIDKAVVNVIMRDPFFARLLIGKLERDDNIPTFATDMEKVYYNSKFSESISLKENQGVIIHELLHINFKHGLRKGNRNHQIWNLACDYSINPLVIADGYKLPQGALIEPRFDKMSAEQIYNILISEAKEAPEGYVGDLLEVDLTDEEIEILEQAINKDLRDACTLAKMAGKNPSEAQKLLIEDVEPVIDWRPYVFQFMSVVNKNDYTWNRPNRRYFGSAFHIPTLFSESIGQILIAIDTSGSIDTKQLSKFVSEVNNFNAQFKADIEVVYCDTSIKGSQIFMNGEMLDLKPVGGGSTLYSPVMNYAKTMNEQPVCIMYFTDGWCDDFKVNPNIPVLWVLDYDYVKFKPPFGEVIKISKHD